MATEKYSPAYETKDAELKPIVRFLGWLTLAVALTFLASYGALRAMQRIPAFGEREAHPLAAMNDPIPPAPHLEMQRGFKQAWDGTPVDLTQRQPFTTQMWSDMKAKLQPQLDGYGWIDQQAKVVHVPIERAMEIALRKGFPVEQKPKD